MTAPAPAAGEREEALIVRPTREEELHLLVRKLTAPIPQFKGMNPAERAGAYRNELSTRVMLGRAELARIEAIKERTP